MAGVGMGVTLSRGLLVAPAMAFFTAVSWLTVVGAVRRGGGTGEVVLSLAHTWGSTRARSILLGVWLAGLLLWGALRVAWIAGAMPLVAWRLSGGRGEQPAFASGVAWRFHRVLPAALVAIVLSGLRAGDAPARRPGRRAGRGPGAGLGVGRHPGLRRRGGACRVRPARDLPFRPRRRGRGPGVDRGEGPAGALSGAMRSFLARPAALLTAVLAVWLATALAAGSVQGILGALAGSVRSGPRAMLLFPEMALAVIAALVASLAEMWRLAAVGVLALGGQEEREPRPSSLRSENFGILPPSQ